MTLQERLRRVFPEPRARGLMASIAKECGVKAPSVSAWFNSPDKVAELSRKHAEAICSKFAQNVNPAWLAEEKGDMLLPLAERKMLPGSLAHLNTEPWPVEPFPIELEGNDEYPAVRRVSVKAQAGITGYAVENCEDGAPIVFRADWYKTHGYRPERMMALRVAGESMVPSLHPGDLIVVNTESTSPRDGVAFLVIYEGEAVVKRLVRDAGAWWLSSDHPDQRRYARKLCDDQTQVVGEVVYKQSERV